MMNTSQRVFVERKPPLPEERLPQGMRTASRSSPDTKPPSGTQVMVFNSSIAASGKGEKEDKVRRNGTIVEIKAHFSADADYNVDTRVMLRQHEVDLPILPTRENAYLALDNADPSYLVNIPVETGATVRVEWRNNDGASAHRVPVEVVVVEE